MLSERLVASDLKMSAYISLPQVTGGHLAQVTGGGGERGGECMFVSSGQFFRSYSYLTLRFWFYPYQF
jgi:hypothetical protein